MNISPTKTAPPEETIESRCPQIFLILAVPAREDHNLLFGESNFIATHILARLIELELKQAGQMAEAANYGGPLNLCVMVFSVCDPHESARIILESLKQFGLLLSFANIFRYDDSEIILRRMHPPARPDIQLANLNEVVNAGIKLSEAMAKEALEILKRHKSPGDEGSQPSPEQ